MQEQQCVTSTADVANKVFCLQFLPILRWFLVTNVLVKQPIKQHQTQQDVCMSEFHQHSIGYMGNSFTGQKTQPTVSKY